MTETGTETKTRRKRRSGHEIQEIKDAIYEFCQENQPVTVRQLFYGLVVQGKIQKSETEYNQTVIRLAKEMRLTSELPWGWLKDNSRWIHKPNSYEGISDFLIEESQNYRLDLWSADQTDDCCEIWLEKDALVNCLYPITSKYDVALLPCKGYPSLTFLWEAASSIARKLDARWDLDKFNSQYFIYYFGDYDPSGNDISRNVKERILEFTRNVLTQGYGYEIVQTYNQLQEAIVFERVGINFDQIERYRLPVRPTKSGDSRAKNFEGGDISVELDSMPPQILRGLAEDRILRHLDTDRFQARKAQERQHRQLIRSMQPTEEDSDLIG